MQQFARNVLINETLIFNYRLSRALRVVEKAFGILANCWRIYHCHIYLNPNNATTVVKATTVLHSILTLPSDKVYTDVDKAKIFDDVFEDLAKQGNQPATSANMRNYFTDYFNSDHGSVKWQNDCP